VSGLVLEVDVHAALAERWDGQQVGVRRPGGLGAHLADRAGEPFAVAGVVPVDVELPAAQRVIAGLR
jgi:hypothetical protein